MGKNETRDIAKKLNRAQEGKVHRVLIEMQSKKNENEWMGRNEQNIKALKILNKTKL